jgi:hypothetical protein
MERVVFCPSDDLLAEAEEMASLWQVPVQVGDSPRTEILKFDRSEVGILNIPTNQFFEMTRTWYQTGRPIVCSYVDEFAAVDKVRGELVGPQGQDIPKSVYSTKYRASFKFWIDFPGDYTFKVVDDEGVIATHDFKVAR